MNAYYSMTDGYALFPQAMHILRQPGGIMTVAGDIVYVESSRQRKRVHSHDIPRLLKVCQMVQSWPSHSVYILKG